MAGLHFLERFLERFPKYTYNYEMDQIETVQIELDIAKALDAYKDKTL